MERVGVAGAGTMGAGIAQIAALGGFATYLYDPDAEALAAGEQRLRADLARGADRGRWSDAEAEAASARLRAARRLDDLDSCELVIEAAPENLELKRDLFRRLEAACDPGAVLATNTSSLSVTAIAADAERPERICGMHFFNPPALMRLAEIIAGEATSDQTLALATAVAERMGRTPIRAADGIGFIANRCVRPFGLEALRLVGERIAPPQQVDRIVRIGGGYRMGPFELMDLVGVDVNLKVAESFFDQSDGLERWRPHPLQARLVADGRLGRKSGRGWYAYGGGPHRPDDPEPPDPAPEAAAVADPAPDAIDGDGFRALAVERARLATLAPDDPLAVGFVALPDLVEARVVELTRGSETSKATATTAERFFADLGKHVEWVGDAPGLVLGRIVCQLVNEGSFAAGEDVGAPADIDTALRLGFNHPRGPFEWADAIGPTRVLAALDALAAELGNDRYRAAPYLRRSATG